MARDLFVDTSGFYALLITRDDCHERASRIMADAARTRRLCWTTDYVLDEAATLLKVRGHGHLVRSFLDRTLESRACRVAWMDPGRFEQSREYFHKHADHEYSFTDCFSFVTMAENALLDALTKDGHFREVGFSPLLV